MADGSLRSAVTVANMKDCREALTRLGTGLRQAGVADAHYQSMNAATQTDFKSDRQHLRKQAREAEKAVDRCFWRHWQPKR